MSDPNNNYISVDTDLNPYSSSNYSSSYVDDSGYVKYNQDVDNYLGEVDYGNLEGDDIRFSGTDTDLDSGYDTRFNSSPSASSSGNGQANREGLFGIDWTRLFGGGGGLGGGLLSLGGSLIGGYFDRKAQKKAAAQQYALEMEKLRMAKAQEDFIKEGIASANRRADSLRGILPSTSSMISSGQRIQDILRPSTEASTQRINDILLGVDAQTRMAEQGNVDRSRAQQVMAQEIAADQAEEDILASLAMGRAVQGFNPGTTSTADTSNLMRGFLRTNLGRVGAAADAGFASAKERQGLSEFSRQEQNKYIDVPFRQYRNLFDFEQFPETSAFDVRMRQEQNLGNLVNTLASPNALVKGVPIPTLQAPPAITGMGSAFGKALTRIGDSQLRREESRREA